MSNVQSRLGSLEDERKITRVLTRYCDLLDTGNADQIASEIFAADGIADYHDYVVTGREAINAFLVENMGQYAHTAHTLSNVFVRSCDGTRAEVTSSITALHWLQEPSNGGSEVHGDLAVIVANTDQLQLMPEGWRITKRQTRPLGRPFLVVQGPSKTMIVDS